MVFVLVVEFKKQFCVFKKFKLVLYKKPFAIKNITIKMWLWERGVGYFFSSHYIY